MKFDYVIDSNDPTIDYIKTDESFYNYNETNLHSFGNSYEDLYYYILYNDNIVFDYIYPKPNFDKKYVLNSINLWEKLGITLHNINVFKLFRNGNKIIIRDSGVFDSFKSSPASSLKVKFRDIPQWDSKVELVEMDENNYKNIAFKDIILPKLDKYLCSTIYAHEVTHTQLMSNGGGTKSIFNEETIPIFMEFIIAEQQKYPNINLKYVNNERLVNVYHFLDALSKGNKLSYQKRVTAEKYVISSLQAIELFRKYYYSTYLKRKEMLNDVKKIINGDKIVEDIIEKYQIDYDDVAKKKKLKLF